jgi:8-oxo-dGTP pyrophosphatase MutT (NUDIX family)
MLATISQRLKHYMPSTVDSEEKNASSKAAVMLLLHGDPLNPHIILTERAKHLSHHAGEVAFPGGMKEPCDQNLLATALRETEEEIGLTSDKIELLGILPSDSPRLSMLRVAPFMGWVASPYDLQPDPSEIATVFNFPLNLLLDTGSYKYFQLSERKIQLPYVMYGQYKIWGFTLKVMVDMLNFVLDAQINLRYPTEQQIQQLRAEQ